MFLGVTIDSGHGPVFHKPATTLNPIVDSVQIQAWLTTLAAQLGTSLWLTYNPQKGKVYFGTGDAARPGGYPVTWQFTGASYETNCPPVSPLAPLPVWGCNDPTASNYDATVTINNGTCTYAPPPPPITIFNYADYPVINSDAYLTNLSTGYGYRVTGMVVNGVALGAAPLQSFSTANPVPVPIQPANRVSIPAYTSPQLTSDKNLVDALNASFAALNAVGFTAHLSPYEERFDYNSLFVSPHYGDGVGLSWPVGTVFSFALAYYENGTQVHQMTFSPASVVINGSTMFSANILQFS